MKRPLGILLVIASTSLAGQQPADDRARTEALAKRAGTRLQALQQEAERLASEARTVLNDLRRLEVERQIKDVEFREASEAADKAQAELAALNVELTRLEQQEQSERPELRARLVELYKLGQGGYLRMLLSTADARDVAHATRMVAVVARRDRDRIEAHRQRVAGLRTTRAALEERTARLVELRAAAERAQAAAAAAVRNRNALIREIDERRDLNARLAGELLQAQQQLQATLKTLADGGNAAVPALPLEPFRGTLSWPADGAVRHRFGRKTGGAAGSASSANGIEIVSTVGAPVRAVHDGAVVFADTFTGYGKLVIVDHGSQTFTLYGHLLDISVARGDRVQQGQPVGAAGFALVGVPGLYFELRVDGRPVDPLQWLEKR